jgi:hypothetical protein
VASHLITFQPSGAGDLISIKPDYGRNVDMPFVMMLCTALVYFADAGADGLARLALPTVEHG